MAEDTSEKPKTLWKHVKKYALRYTAGIGIAMGCADKMGGLIKVSSWVAYVAHDYRHILLAIYSYLGSLIHVHIPAFVGDMALMFFFYTSVMVYGVTHGKPIDVPVATTRQKLLFVAKRVPVSMAMISTCLIFIGSPLSFVISSALVMLPNFLLLYFFIVLRVKVVRFQLEREHVRLLVLIWLFIGIMAVLSQTKVFEYLAGDPPPISQEDSSSGSTER